MNQKSLNIPFLFFSAAPFRGRRTGSSISISLCPLRLPLSHQPPSCSPCPHHIHKPPPWSSFSPPASASILSILLLKYPTSLSCTRPNLPSFASLALSPRHPTCAVPLMYSFLILSILITPNETHSIFNSETSSSKSYPFTLPALSSSLLYHTLHDFGQLTQSILNSSTVATSTPCDLTIPPPSDT